MHKPYKAPSLVLGEDLRAYLLSHATLASNADWLYEVHTPLHVFKKAHHNTGFNRRVLVNLVIPAGETVFADEQAWSANSFGFSFRKMRASRAIVHSIVGIDDHEPVAIARSDYDVYFKYHKGRNVVPGRFSNLNSICNAGIHFFLNVGDALDYQL